jgi:signal transduction histidine kinase
VVELTVLADIDTQPRTLAERLGGRWAVSVAGHVITFPLGVIGLSPAILHLGWPDGALIPAGLLVAYGINAIIDVILNRTRWSNRHVVPVPAWEVVARLAFVGLTIGAIFATIRTWFDVTTPAGALEGMTVYPIIAVWAGITVIVHLDVIDQARSLRQRLVVERARAVDIAERATTTLHDVRASVDRVLAPGMDHLRSVADGSASVDVRSAPDEIRAVVDQSVRDVGRELWQRSDATPSWIGPREILRSVVAVPVFRPWPIVGLSVLAPLLEDPSTASPPVILFVTVFTALLFGECTLANRLMARGRSWHVPVLVATIAVFVGQYFLVDYFNPSWIDESESPGVVAVVVLTVLLVVATSALGSYRDLNDQRAVMIAEAIAEDRLDAAAHAHVVSEETRRLAALLHGRVQSRLLGCAMAIEFAQDDPVAIRAALDRTLAVVSEEWAELDKANSIPLSKVVATWAGLCELRIDGDDSVPASVAEDAAVVVEELVANAVRHGRASQVTINITSHSDHLVITAVDNGEGGGDLGRPGLGSAVLARAGNVDRQPEQTGWTVTVRLPI